jgi:hypothetical protein
LKSYDYDRDDSRLEEMTKDPEGYFKKVRARVLKDTEAVAAGTSGRDAIKKPAKNRVITKKR